MLLQEYVPVAQSHSFRHVSCPCCPQQQEKKRLSFSLSGVLVSAPSNTAMVVPFILIMIVEFLSLAHTWPRRPSDSQPKSVELWNSLIFCQRLVSGSRTYAACAIRAKANMVILSEIFGPAISSIVHADGESVQTSPSSRAARIIGSTAAGRRSFSRCI